MLVWGGYGTDYLNTGARYDPATDSWATMSSANVPTARWRHGAVWTGLHQAIEAAIGEFNINCLRRRTHDIICPKCKHVFDNDNTENIFTRGVAAATGAGAGALLGSGDSKQFARRERMGRKNCKSFRKKNSFRHRFHPFRPA